VRCEGFNPEVGATARVLILGTLPGAESLRARQYLANGQNSFWRIAGEIYDFSSEDPYAERIAKLQQHGIALWDVCASGCRTGSLDSKIIRSTIVPNDFAAFFDDHPEIQLICFNGTTAEEIYRKKVLPTLPPNTQMIERRLLPSTSPANARMGFAEKLSRWRSVLDTSGSQA